MQHGGTRQRRAAIAGVLATAMTVAAITLSAGSTGAVEADGLDQVPPPIDGEVVYIPWTTTGDMGITIDGNLDDWAGVPTIVTSDGPLPSADLAANGEMTWSVIAEGSKLYVSATITDDSIIAGEHEDGYWNEDSIEVFLNATDALDTSTYVPGIGQVRFSAVDIGNTDPTALTLSGTNADTFDVEGIVFATPDGWGVEGVIDFSQWIEPTHGLSLGFQMHANGASTADRDLKVIWSKADADDLSFDNPSVFGTAVLFELGQPDVPAPADRVVTAANSATTQSTAAPETSEQPTTTTPAPTTTTADDASPTTEDTAPVTSPTTTTDNGDWTQSPLLWLVPLALGLVFLGSFLVSRRRPSDDDADPDESAV